VPSLYAGSSLEVAIYETIFHDIDAKAPLKTVPMFAVQSKSHSALRTKRDLTLAELRAPDLKKLGLKGAELTAAPAAHYVQTALWAAAIHTQFHDVHGLVWTSNQCDPDSAYMFFGSKLGTTDFIASKTRDAAQDDDLMSDIRRAGQRAGIVITL
jgi:hypothetical protein